MSDRVGYHAKTVREMTLGDELSLFDAATGVAYALNRTARQVWELADGDCTVDDVVQALARLYGVTEMDIEDDVRNTLSELSSAGALVTRSP